MLYNATMSLFDERFIRRYCGGLKFLSIFWRIGRESVLRSGKTVGQNKSHPDG